MAIHPKNAMSVEVDAFNHQAVLKNATGSNSPESVKRDVAALHTAWLRQAEAIVQEGTPIEISPSFADLPEDIAEKVERGRRFKQATCLR